MEAGTALRLWGFLCSGILAFLAVARPAFGEQQTVKADFDNDFFTSRERFKK